MEKHGKMVHDGMQFSQTSILYAIDRFVKSVNNMDSTILVPSKLRDMDINCKKRYKSADVPPPLMHSDLYNFYMMLNEVKKELIWGPGCEISVNNCVPFDNHRGLKHIRQSSDDSLGSLGSTISHSDLETDSETDSLLMDKDSMDENTAHLSTSFKNHLQGLYSILHRFADSADFISAKYQEEIDATSL